MTKPAEMGSGSDVDKATELVDRVAKRLRRELDLTCDLDDLRGWGHQGWLEAKQRFDPQRGVRFSSFAYYRVRGAVIDGVRKQGWLPRRAYAKLRALEAADRLSEQHGAETASEQSASIASRAQDVDALLGRISAAFALASAAPDEVETETPETQLDTAKVQAAVRRSVDTLPEKERDLLTAVYFEGLTLEEGGSRIGLSKSWASRLHAKALDRMRGLLSQQGLG